MAIGGNEDYSGDMTVLVTFVSLAGGDQARIAIIPAASATPDETAATYEQLFRGLGVHDRAVMRAESREAADHEDNVADIANATGIFMTGGDQSFTRNPADVLKLDRKSRLREGSNAELVVLERDSLGVRHVVARGRVVVRDGVVVGGLDSASQVGG